MNRFTMSLKEIWDGNPCLEGWLHILRLRGKIDRKTWLMCMREKLFPVVDLDEDQFDTPPELEFNECFYAMRYWGEDEHLWRLYAVWLIRDAGVTSDLIEETIERIKAKKPLKAHRKKVFKALEQLEPNAGYARILVNPCSVSAAERMIAQLGETEERRAKLQEVLLTGECDV